MQATFTKAALAALVILPVYSFGRDTKLTDASAISALMRSIPAGSSNLESRFNEAGLHVLSVRGHTLTKTEAAEDPSHWKEGDIEYWFWTSGEPKTPGCETAGSPMLLKHKTQYIAQDRMGVWLLTGKCEAPK